MEWQGDAGGVLSCPILDINTLELTGNIRVVLNVELMKCNRSSFDLYIFANFNIKVK